MFSVVSAPRSPRTGPTPDRRDRSTSTALTRCLRPPWHSRLAKAAHDDDREHMPGAIGWERNKVLQAPPAGAGARIRPLTCYGRPGRHPGQAFSRTVSAMMSNQNLISSAVLEGPAVAHALHLRQRSAWRSPRRVFNGNDSKRTFCPENGTWSRGPFCHSLRLVGFLTRSPASRHHPALLQPRWKHRCEPPVKTALHPADQDHRSSASRSRKEPDLTCWARHHLIDWENHRHLEPP